MQQAAGGMDELGSLAIGCNAPVSLLASITDTSAGGPLASVARRLVQIDDARRG